MAGSTESSGNGPFEYNPSFPMSIVMAILWVIVVVGITWQYFKHRAWFFWCMLLGCFMETVGFIARVAAIKVRHTDNTTPYIVSFVLILLAPSFMAAACYMAFGRLIYYVTPPARRNFRNMWVPARFITPIFVLFDVFGFLIQALGGIRVATAVSKMNDKNSTLADLKDARDGLQQGYTIAKIGVIVQLACFGFFTFVGARILFVAKQWQSSWPDPGRWKRLAWAINGSCALILFRAIFRLIEFLGGDASDYISKHEWFIYVFDAFPMLFVFIVFFIFPPKSYLPQIFMSVRFKKHLAAQEKMGGASTEGLGVPMAAYTGTRGRDSEAALGAR